MMKQSILLFLALASFTRSTGQCFGDIHLTSQAQVDQFQTTYPDCDSLINGSLHIGPSTDISNLNGLAGLRYVENNIHIVDNSVLTTLSGLEGIQTFSQNSYNPFLPPDSLVIRGNIQLNSLVGFGNIQTQTGDTDFQVLIADNPVLQNLEGLEFLKNAGFYTVSFDAPKKRGGIAIQNNAQLESLAGLSSLRFGILDILNNDHLQDLNGIGPMFGVTNASAILNIVGNDGLSNLAGLDSIRQLRSITLENNTSLESLQGLQNLNKVEGGYLCSEGCVLTFGMTIRNNPALEDLSGLETLQSIAGYLTIDDNLNLKNLHGLDNLTEMPLGSLNIINNSSLQNLDALQQLEEIGSAVTFQRLGGFLTIKGNESLVSLAGLSNLDSLTELVVENNVLLQNLSGLDSVRQIATNCIIQGNNSLHNLTGLDQLNRIGGELAIRLNEQLTDLTGLNQLTSVGSELIEPYPYVTIQGNDLLSNIQALSSLVLDPQKFVWITENPALTVCDIEPICINIANQGIMIVEQNATGCNSADQIEAACQASGIESADDFSLIKLFPNPVASWFYIDTPTPVEVMVFNSQGKMMYQGHSSNAVQTTGWPAGVYLVRAVAGGRVSVGKVVKR
ncbi:MAG: T9SS type A sorting domain-containing protein [Saprospiraceae bacterium]|nr:T9SS type A sorting domain-containing protein [Saprospiraceae bacterium]